MGVYPDQPLLGTAFLSGDNSDLYIPRTFLPRSGSFFFDMRHERNVLCDMHCHMQVMETHSRTRERRTQKCLGLIRSLNEGLGVPRSCAPFQLCSWERVLLVWPIMTKFSRGA